MLGGGKSLVSIVKLILLEAPAPYGSRQGGHVIIFMPFFTPRGPRITHPKNGCNQFSCFCGTWEQTDGQTVNYSKMQAKFQAATFHGLGSVTTPWLFSQDPGYSLFTMAS